MELVDIIYAPKMSEKYSGEGGAQGRIAFFVNVDANKFQIKDAAKKLFGVEVIGVNTMIQGGKKKRVGKTMGRRKTWKRAVITFASEVDLNNVDQLMNWEEKTLKAA